MNQKDLIKFRINLPIMPTRSESKLNKFFNGYLQDIIYFNFFFIFSFAFSFIIYNKTQLFIEFSHIGLSYMIIAALFNFLVLIVPVLFCMYQKNVKHNEDFKNTHYYDFIQIAFNFHHIFSYYLWKKKFKNTKCFIKNDMFVLEANSNHSFIENIDTISKNPIKQNQFKGKLFLFLYQ